MKKYLILIAPFLFLLSGCAIFSSTITFTPVDGLSDIKISSRTAPAKISNESDKTLEAQGYAYIGFVRSEDVVKTCWEKDCVNFTCTDNLPHRDTTKEVLEKAAAQGGDLVILQSDSVRSENSTTKTGKCTGGYSTSYTEQECSGGYGKVARVCQNVTKKRYTCTSWQTEYGRKCTFASAGTVWRQDPELKQRDQYIKEYKRLSEAYLKNRIDKYKPDEVKYPEKMRVDTKYGFKDKYGKVVISPQFSDTYGDGWSEGLQAVAVGRVLNEKWGFIDKTGKWVIQPSYDVRPRSFQEGLAAVSVEKRWGFINKKGIFVIKPQFTNAYWFTEGLAAVAVDNKWGYIDKQGNRMIKPQFNVAFPFSEGLAQVAIEGKWGYVDKQGNFVLKPLFDYAEDFVKGIARVVVGNRCRIINKRGELLADDIAQTDGSCPFR
jgi:uncharacterized protein YcfJ